jgi:hypothetical protein
VLVFKICFFKFYHICIHMLYYLLICIVVHCKVNGFVVAAAWEYYLPRWYPHGKEMPCTTHTHWGSIHVLRFCPNLCWHFILSSNKPCGSLWSQQSCMCCCLEIPAANLVSTWKRHPLYQTYHIYQVQDDCNLRQHPKNKMYAKKKYFTVNFIHLIHKVCKMLSAFTSQWHCLHLHSQYLHLPHTNC